MHRLGTPNSACFFVSSALCSAPVGDDDVFAAAAEDGITSLNFFGGKGKAREDVPLPKLSRVVAPLDFSQQLPMQTTANAENTVSFVERERESDQGILA